MQQTTIPGKVTVWTIGHSNRSIEKFVDLLQEHKIETLVDVRSFPTSKIEHFKKNRMEQWLIEYVIDYTWLGKELGDYRLGGYKAFMKTKLFKDGIRKLLEIAKKKRTSILYMELGPKYCHRSFISAHIDGKGVEVIHILK